MNKTTILACITFGLASCLAPEYEEPTVSLEEYQVAPGFNLEAIASEPFIDAPVALDFDNQGRMWVVEMRGYMRNLEGTGEDLPDGAITILEDLDNDGVTDHVKTFLDGLVLPRSLAHVYGGLLYAEPPNLWFIEIENDQPGKRVLVDSMYADAGNVEHQPNGLMMNIDNWIYNAKSNFRYQRKNGEWIKEPTSYRGQWGISKDNFGRLYTNTNSTQLMGDHVLPNMVISHEYFRPRKSINQSLTSDQRIYPLHATSVNRGYQKGVLDADSMLVNVTSACGPLIYRGDNFPPEYIENAFVCVPEANIVKRNILSYKDAKTSAKQAWNDHEFIASTDEGFRPVNLFNGPDGAMYIVDMHRGIIQHKAFMTPYMQEHLEKKKLDEVIGMGRILKVTATDSEIDQVPNFDDLEIKELVNLLKSTNGWVRDRAQQILIFRNDLSAVAPLLNIAHASSDPIAQIHALHTLNGLDQLSFEELEKAARAGSESSLHALILLKKFVTEPNIGAMQNLVIDLIGTSLETDLYIAAGLAPWTKLAPNEFLKILADIGKINLGNEIIEEAIISSIYDLEDDFVGLMDSGVMNQSLSLVESNRINDRKNSIFVNVGVGEDGRTTGLKLYRSICSACHGPDGNGIDGLAPPLRNSEYVKGPVERLGKIILHGLQGPVTVDGIRYEMNEAMPGLANNKDISDNDIANIIRYLHNSFVMGSKSVSSDQIKSLREQRPSNGQAFTEKELLKSIE